MLETKFMYLRMPVTVGSRFGDWRVTWGGWSRYKLHYVVMVVRASSQLSCNSFEPERFMSSRDRDRARRNE
jgi:hypothetical protein